MWRIGFGFERLGLLALRLPVLFTVLLAILCAVAVYNVRNLSFNGSVIAVLPDQSPAYVDYYKLKRTYRNFSRDVTILIESDRLLTASGLEDLRNLQLDVALADGVAKATTIFATPDVDPVTGETREWFPDEFTSDEQAAELVKGLIEKYPQVASLFSLERNTAVIVASLTSGVQEDDKESFKAYQSLRKTAEEFAPPDFKLSFTGLTPVGSEVLNALISDQSKLTVFGLLLGTSIAFYIFRSLVAALICAVPPAITALWSFGLFSMFSIEINYLTTVLPTLALILAFADGIFLYFKWQTSNAQSDDLDANLHDAIVRVGPASSLTSITTAIAFLSFSYAESEALKEFAFLGAGVVALAFVGVIIGLPLVIHWVIRLGLVKPGTSRAPIFQRVGRYARSIAMGYPAAIAFVGVVLVICFGIIQQNVRAEYNLTDYLPLNSDIRYGEELANEVIGGRALLLVSLPFAEDDGFSSKANRQRLDEVDSIVSAEFPSNTIFSANTVLKTLKTEAAIDKINELAKNAPETARSDFLSTDGKNALISVRLQSTKSVVEVNEDVAKLRKALSALSYGNDVVITGFPVLMSVEFTTLIDQLRDSLLIAILLGILIVGVATRSPFITLAALTPNLLPIFFVLVFLYMRGGTINLSEVVALTIAFGIAIDNAVHLINVYDAEKRQGKETRHALASAIEGVGPALTAGTVIICVSTLVTQISALPVVPVLGQLMISTLFVALIANLLILPANILTLERIRDWLIPSRK